jgi:hypothetical protein
LTVAYWRSACVICGGPYEVFTFLDPAAILNYPKPFDVVTCPAHRMTASEWGKLSGTKRVNRHQAFEQIKTALASRTNSTH